VLVKGRTADADEGGEAPHHDCFDALLIEQPAGGRKELGAPLLADHGVASSAGHCGRLRAGCRDPLIGPSRLWRCVVFSDERAGQFLDRSPQMPLAIWVVGLLRGAGDFGAIHVGT
jgi:hypothetical protein